MCCVGFCHRRVGKGEQACHVLVLSLHTDHHPSPAPTPPLPPLPPHPQMFAAEVMLMISSIIHLGRSGIPKEPITFDDFERMSVCVRSLAERQPVMSEVRMRVK